MAAEVQKMAKGYKAVLRRILDDIPAEDRLAGLAAEQVLGTFAPEERVAGLAPSSQAPRLATTPCLPYLMSFFPLSPQRPSPRCPPTCWLASNKDSPRSPFVLRPRRLAPSGGVDTLASGNVSLRAATLDRAEAPGALARPNTEPLGSPGSARRHDRCHGA